MGMRISLLVFAAIVALFPLATHTQWVQLPPPQPLCASEYTLVNYACTHLPYTPGPPPSPPSLPSPPPAPADDRNHHNHGHRRRHHRHREHHQETAVEAECCKWLEQMDPKCVCNLLVHLPPFLVRSAHNYTVIVDESCSKTFPCGRVIR